MRLESTVTKSDMHGFAASDAIDLLDWKRTIFDLYAFIRHAQDPEAAWGRWRGVRDHLYAEHPQSPIPSDARGGFDGCPFYDYDPAFRTLARIEDRAPERRGITVSTGGTFAFTRIGVVRFTLAGAEHELELSWNEGYGGGIFLAFGDETTGQTTYGGGRYLIDTVKGADLGFDGAEGTVVLDFNFAFNPSCSYDPSWACPLAPAVNRLPIAVTAGERLLA
jgi:uncharacterized protein (DUF1684 family)